nr:ATP-binding protein [Chachezhania sediminis]
MALLMFCAGVTGIVIVALVALRARIRVREHQVAMATLDSFIQHDAAPAFVTDETGAICTCNAAALRQHPQDGGDAQPLSTVLRGLFANPAAVLVRLQSQARTDGTAHEDVLTSRGHVRLSAQAIGDSGYLWRLHDIARSGQLSGPDQYRLPVLTVGRGGAILAMNQQARKLVGTQASSIDQIFRQAPRNNALNRVDGSDGPTDVAVARLGGPAGREDWLMVPVGESATGPAGLDTLPVPLVEVDADGRVVQANWLAAALLLMEPGEKVHIEDLMQGLSRPVTDWIRDAAHGLTSKNTEFLKLKRPEREVFVQGSLNRVGQGESARLVAVLNDATELKTLEAQFVQSQKMQAIGQLAGGVAHDFNNLLTAISGHCDLLLLRHDPGDQDYGDLVQIVQNANRAASLVGQLLAFSRKQTLRPESLDLRDTLADLTHLLNRLVGERVTLTLSHDPILKSIRADKRQLEQVLMNLVVNARDAMPDGGEIRIETEVVSLDEPLVRDRATVPPGEYVTLRVSDEGMGIGADKLTKVFEPFYTTKRTGEGTGLGLSTAYGIVKQSGGFIFVDSVEGQGTVFTLYFPSYKASSDAPEVPLPAEPAAAPRQGEGVVLLVEDEPPVRAFASRALRLRGYTVLEAESGEDALRQLEDPDLAVDVFVTDVVMPGLDGPSWVRKAMQNRPDVRVVFVSGYAEDAFGDNGPSLPNSVFLPKPFSLNQLTETVYQQLA